MELIKSLDRISTKRGGKDLRSEDWSSDGDESGVDLRFSIGGCDDGVRGQERDFGTSGDVAVLGRGCEHWERLRKPR